MSSFISNNQAVTSPDFQRRLLIANILVRRYGPAWYPDGVLHVSYPENAIVIFYPDDPWGLNARPDLPMNELGTIKATLQSTNPDRKAVWTGLYYDETVGEWTITYEIPVDYAGRHLINPSMDVQLKSVMSRLETDHPEGAYNFILFSGLLCHIKTGPSAASTPAKRGVPYCLRKVRRRIAIPPGASFGTKK